MIALAVNDVGSKPGQTETHYTRAFRGKAERKREQRGLSWVTRHASNHWWRISQDHGDYETESGGAPEHQVRR